MLDDLELFLKLNEEYAPKPLVSEPLKYDPESLLDRGRRKARGMDERYHLKGKRIIEVGCGYGETATALKREIDCEVVAVDINPEMVEKWKEDTTGVDFRLFDICTQDLSSLGKFDFTYSNGVMEHVVHPFAMLTALTKLISPGGTLHFNMGLHRGTMGSHLYRDVHFPWPHLLFTDSTFERFYQHLGQSPQKPVWINYVTAAQYLHMYDLVGLHVEDVWYSTRPIDRPFYERFEDILSRYPIFDLERDLMYVDVKVPVEGEMLRLVNPWRTERPTLKDKRLEALAAEVKRLEEAASAVPNVVDRGSADEELNRVSKLAADHLDEIQRLDKLATDRLAEIQRLSAAVQQANEQARVVQQLRGVASDLQKKVERLQVIEERFDRDVRGIRKFGRAVSWTGSTLLNAVKSAVPRALGNGSGPPKIG